MDIYIYLSKQKLKTKETYKKPDEPKLDKSVNTLSLHPCIAHDIPWLKSRVNIEPEHESSPPHSIIHPPKDCEQLNVHLTNWHELSPEHNISPIFDPVICVCAHEKSPLQWIYRRRRQI